jgi:subtilisin family serine protease
MADAFARHPNVLFVAAAGNDGQWRDGENLLQMPCGIKQPNVLCVGALREDGTPTTFTNMTMSGADVVFALGHKVLSTVPMQMCTGPSMQKLAAAGTLFGEEPAVLAPKLKEECLKSPGMGTLSGTSMASPLVAHIAAEVLAEKPELDARGVIREIYARAVPSFVGTAPVFKLRVRKPSWYPRAGAAALGLGAEPGEFFEGIVTSEMAGANQ